MVKKKERPEAIAAKIAKEKPCKNCIYYRDDNLIACAKDCDFHHSSFQRRKYIETI